MEEFRILIVEDNKIYLELFRNILRKAFPEIDIDVVTDGREVLHKVDDFRPNLIFMDIHLEEENGIELTKKIKATHPNIAIIILTFYDMPEYRQAALTCGAERFLAKPSLSTTEIKELIKSHLKPYNNLN